MSMRVLESFQVGLNGKFLRLSIVWRRVIIYGAINGVNEIEFK